MARTSAKRTTARQQKKVRQLQEKVVGLFFIGLAMVVLPSLIGNPIIHNGLGPLRKVGWLLIFVGAVVIGAQQLMRRRAAAGLDAASLPAAVNKEPAWNSEPRATVQQSDTASARTFSASRTSAATAPSGTQATRDAQQPQTPSNWSGEVFDVIEWRRFEALCERLFAQAGFETKSQSHGADEGIDIWLYSKTKPDVAVSLVQCKCWGSRVVKVAEVRALLGSMAAKRVERGVFATTSRFSADAAQFAKENGIHMLDRTGLLDLIGKRTPEQQQELLAVATEGEFWKPTCASCGVKMLRRPPKNGRNAFWGCVNFPRCRTTINGA